MMHSKEKITPFLDQSDPTDSLLLSPEETLLAGTTFTALCDDLLLQHAGEVRVGASLITNMPFSNFITSTRYDDGSRLFVSVTHRSPSLLQVESLHSRSASYQIDLTTNGIDTNRTMHYLVTTYEFDELSKTVKKKSEDLADTVGSIATILESPPSKDPDNDPAMKELLTMFDNTMEMREFEQQLAIDKYSLVGQEEVMKLRALVQDLELISE